MSTKAYIDTPEGQIHYRFTGGPRAPLVLFHMTAASSAAFEPLMLALDGHVPTIAIDTMNYGPDLVKWDHKPRRCSQ